MLVKVITMPSIKELNGPTDRGLYPNSEGVVLRDWVAVSDHLDCRLQYVDILIDGQIVRYWKPLIGLTKDFWDGFWEIAGERTGSYTMTLVQSSLHE